MKTFTLAVKRRTTTVSALLRLSHIGWAPAHSPPEARIHIDIRQLWLNDWRFPMVVCAGVQMAAVGQAPPYWLWGRPPAEQITGSPETHLAPQRAQISRRHHLN